MTEASATGKTNPFVYVAAAVAALGGLLFGYDTGIISAALLFIGPEFGLSDAAKQAVVASLLAGALLGAASAGAFADRFGRRPSLLAAAVVFVLGAVASALAAGPVTLAAARFALGVAIGAAALVVPVYIAEIAPSRVRGALVSLQQFMITLGILLAYLVGYALEASGAWRWMLGLGAVPAAALLIGMAFLPESPRWFLADGQGGKARAVLKRVRDPGEDVEAEAGAIEEQIRLESGAGYRELLSPRVRPALIVGVGVALFNQFVGVNAVIYYAPTILADAGFTSAGAILATVGVGVVNAAVTLAALLLIDRVGRRPLLLAGNGLVLLSLVVLGSAYLVPAGARGVLLVGGLMVYIAAFAASWGIAIWLLNAEVYPLRVRGKGSGAGGLAHWAGDLLIASTFLSLVNAAGPTAAFWLFGAVALAGLVFVHRRVPETKGRSLEDIERDLGRRA